MTTWTRLARPAFHVVAVLEALTWLGLLAGMGAHYLGDASRVGIEVFGPIHGGVFVLYCLVTVAAGIALRWHWAVVLLALVASVPPLATVVFDVVAGRRGHLDRRSAWAPSPSRAG